MAVTADQIPGMRVGSSFRWAAVLIGLTFWAPAVEGADRSSYQRVFYEAQPVVPGSRARLIRGVAHAPERAPLAVKQAIWAANTLQRKPYRYGGGHGGFFDNAYDCSGTVSFALGAAGVLGSPRTSRDLMDYGNRGQGRWITVYARNGHTFAVIAGLRLDATGQGYWSAGPRWRQDMRSTRGFVARHPEGM